jgi:hypothetical protein
MMVLSAKGVVIVLQAYFDGGNKADSRRYKILTLAGCAAQAKDWPSFEERWNRVLHRHWTSVLGNKWPKLFPEYQGIPFLHMTDLMSGNRPFSRQNGWDASRINTFVSDCVTALEIHSAQMLMSSCSVILADYKKVLAALPGLPPVEHLCNVFCVGHSLMRYWPAVLHDKAELYFDRGETFCGHMRNLWNNKTNKNRLTWSCIRQIGEINMRDTPVAQPADLLAWSINRAYERGQIENEWQSRLLAINRASEWFDEKRLRGPIPGSLERYQKAKEKLPTRKPMP